MCHAIPSLTVFGHRRRRRQLQIHLHRSLARQAPRSVRIHRGELTRPKARLAVIGLAYRLTFTPSCHAVCYCTCCGAVGHAQNSSLFTVSSGRGYSTAHRPLACPGTPQALSRGGGKQSRRATSRTTLLQIL